MPRIDVDTITFETGSADIADTEIGNLETIGVAIEEAIYENPSEVFLIEGHTDAVGAAEYNLGLSDSRAESVAQILTEYFEIPPENLVTQGFGKQYLKEQTQGPSRINRRVTVRRITPLLSADDQIAGMEGQNLD
ncbi:OmpA family protein [Acuticoccus sp. I52.16.1]|nr:OmpA family protein [Acuticoccus sp. I52.16.1]